MLNKLKPKSEFSRNVLTLMTGTTIAQAIPIAISPILTRIYTPEDFGVFALFSSISMILYAISTAKYESAIMLPQKENEAESVLILSLMITIFMTFLVLFFVVSFHDNILRLLQNKEISIWLYWLPASVFFSGIFQSFNYWSNRNKKYKLIAKTKVLQTGSISVTSIGAHFFVHGGGGLIISQIFGNFIATFRLVWVTIKENPLLLNKFYIKNLFTVAKKYKHFPIYALPAAAINMSAKELSKIFIGTYLGISILGFFSLTHRVTLLPIGLLASSFQQVFLQHGREQYTKTGECLNIYKSIFIKLFIVSFGIFGLAFFFLPDLFVFAFGKEWRISGEYAQLMVPFYIIYMIASPLSQMYIIAEKQKIGLYWQIGFFIISIGSIIIGSMIFDSSKDVIMLFSMANFIAFSINLFLTYQIAKGKL